MIAFVKEWWGPVLAAVLLQLLASSVTIVAVATRYI